MKTKNHFAHQAQRIPNYGPIPVRQVKTKNSVFTQNTKLLPTSFNKNVYGINMCKPEQIYQPLRCYARVNDLTAINVTTKRHNPWNINGEVQFSFPQIQFNHVIKRKPMSSYEARRPRENLRKGQNQMILEKLQSKYSLMMKEQKKMTKSGIGFYKNNNEDIRKQRNLVNDLDKVNQSKTTVIPSKTMTLGFFDNKSRIDAEQLDQQRHCFNKPADDMNIKLKTKEEVINKSLSDIEIKDDFRVTAKIFSSTNHNMSNKNINENDKENKDENEKEPNNIDIKKTILGHMNEEYCDILKPLSFIKPKPQSKKHTPSHSHNNSNINNNHKVNISPIRTIPNDKDNNKPLSNKSSNKKSGTIPQINIEKITLDEKELKPNTKRETEPDLPPQSLPESGPDIEGEDLRQKKRASSSHFNMSKINVNKIINQVIENNKRAAAAKTKDFFSEVGKDFRNTHMRKTNTNFFTPNANNNYTGGEPQEAPKTLNSLDLKLFSPLDWRKHEEIWSNVSSVSTFSNDLEKHLIPPNENDVLISSYLKLFPAVLNFCTVTNICTLNQTQSNLIKITISDSIQNPKLEMKKWKDAYKRVVLRWHPDKMFGLLNEIKLKDESKIGLLKKKSPIIMNNMNILFKQIMEILKKIQLNKANDIGKTNND